MSFFGFDTTLPRDQQQSGQPAGANRGIFDAYDPFASLHASNQDDAGVTLDFEETYDGLGQQLDESGDGFNDDTFGGEDDGPVTRESVGRDFDFAGQTANVRNVLLEEQSALHQHGAQVPARGPVQNSSAYGRVPAQQQQQQQSKPMRTGYEAYRQPEYIPKLEADASIWGPSVAQKSSATAPQPAAPVAEALSSKMLSLEEVEAQMRAQSRPVAPQSSQQASAQTLGLKNMLGLGGGGSNLGSSPGPQAPQILHRPQQQQMPPPGFQDIQQQQQQQQFQPDYGLRAPQILQRQQSPQQQPGRPQSQAFDPRQMGQPVLPPQAPRGPAAGIQAGGVPPGHTRGPSYPGPPITHPQQVMQMDPSARAAFMADEARRAKRNHKIFLLSRYNGLMTPQDKNFITRIQLQQLLTATGGVPTGGAGGDAADSDAASAAADASLAEDFYYQVMAQIRGPPPPPRGGPVGGPAGQGPLNQFAQTYLLQTGGAPSGPASSRYGYGRGRNNGGRRHNQNPDNHVARMEQQVARAVEAARNRPKNKQLVLAGSLGKIAFSNSKTPRPLLNLQPRNETSSPAPSAPPTITLGAPLGSEKQIRADRKAALRNIERLYSVLMRLEDHERRFPPPSLALQEDSPPEVIEAHMTWRRELQSLNKKLWESTMVMEPVGSGSTPHPFIQLLGPGKGKKAIPRVFRHLDDQQRLTMLTLLALHLDQLDVVRDAYGPLIDGTPLPPLVREEVEVFSAAVMPPLFSYVNEAPLGIIIGLVGLILDRVVVPAIVRTKIGISVLTMLISRAELVKQVSSSSSSSGAASSANAPTQDDWRHWTDLYSRLFDTLEPVLPHLFPTSSAGLAASSEDVHIWQFLAAMGVGASPDQQQRLVLGVKDRVMESVAVGKTLPEGMREQRLGEVNLFMRAIGLDVELLG